MIQFNLLPDVKIDYIKANRLKRSLITIACLVAVGSVIVAVLLYLGVGVVQKKRLESLNKDLKATAASLSSTPDINRIITVSNQLTSLPSLHADKPAASRIFGFLAQVTPAEITISSASVDFTANTITLSGNAKDLLGVNTYVDTLKYTTYTKAVDDTSKTKAFSKVLLAGFSTTEKGATYQISFSFDPEIVKNQNTITLVVPQTITTRSEINQPTSLFAAPQPTTTTKAGTR